MLHSEPSRPPHVDRRALQAVLGGLEQIGVNVDRDLALVWAGIVRGWPDIDADPTATQRETARRMFAAGASMTTISSEIGRHRHTVGAWVSDLGPPRVGRGHRASEEALKQAFELVRQGKTQRAAAAEVGIDQSVISRALSRPDHGLAA